MNGNLANKIQSYLYSDNPRYAHLSKLSQILQETLKEKKLLEMASRQREKKEMNDTFDGSQEKLNVAIGELAIAEEDEEGQE